MNLFNILPESFFNPLVSKYKSVYFDCLQLIYNTYKTELSFGIEKEVIVDKLENYFENKSNEITFDEDENNITNNPRSKANGVLNRLKECGWIEIDQGYDFKQRVNLNDDAITMIEAFNRIIKKEELEYESLLSQIHSTLINTENYAKPYEHMVKLVIKNTEELMIGLKKLNTNIKKYIDAIVNTKTANEIVKDYFTYNEEIGSKAYHRMKTSENIAHFRLTIIKKIKDIIDNEDVFSKTVKGYMAIEENQNENEVREILKDKLVTVINSFQKYDDIAQEIDEKHSRYLKSAVARAKFLLTNTNNIEGKLNDFLGFLANEFNQDKNLNLNDDLSDSVLRIFNIFPQGFIDSDSLYTIPITKKMGIPDVLNVNDYISSEERKFKRELFLKQHENQFSLAKINQFVETILKQSNIIQASSLDIRTKKDFIRLIFVRLYGNNRKAIYKVETKHNPCKVNNFGFNDFLIIKKG